MELEIGIKKEMEFTVREEDTASFLGSGDVSVLSTPAMISMMENTSRLLVQEKLPEGYTTVGTHVDISHLKAAPLGAKIIVRSELIKQEGRKLLFKVEAFWKDVKIGEGIHERFIVNREKFLKKLRNNLA
ncbi:MAG: thioesterase family protein [Candidatus Njordarchaeales archaeon]